MRGLDDYRGKKIVAFDVVQDGDDVGNLYCSALKIVFETGETMIIEPQIVPYDTTGLTIAVFEKKMLVGGTPENEDD
jgi:hypothetical protein